MADAKAPAKSGSKKDAPETTHWAFVGPYACTYTPPDRVSREVAPGDVIEWGEDGPPDVHWEPAEAPKAEDKPAPSKTEGKE
jgi:hypothetical protein